MIMLIELKKKTTFFMLYTVDKRAVFKPTNPAKGCNN